MSDFSTHTDAQLQEVLDACNEQVNVIKTTARAVTAEQNFRLAKQRMGAVIENLPPAVRDQVLKAHGVQSAEDHGKAKGKAE